MGNSAKASKQFTAAKLHALLPFIGGLVCSLLLACGGPTANGFDSHEPPPIGAPLQQPPWPRAQASNLLTETLLDGVNVYAKSDGAVEQGTALELGSQPGGYEWAVYRFDPGAEALDSVAVLLDVPPGSAAWIGLADFPRHTWVFCGPHPQSKTLAVDDSRYHSPAGELFLCVVVYGGDSATVQSLGVRTVRPDNEAPWAELTVDTAGGDAPLAVSFDAGGSIDPDGEIRYYMWDFDGDGNYEAMTFDATTAFTYTAPGIFYAAMAVVDDYGAWGGAAVEIGVTVPGNASPIAELQATPASGDAPLAVQLDAGASSDADGSIVRYDYDFDSDGIWDAYDAGASVGHTYEVPGDYAAKLRVTDDAGAQSVDTVAVDVWEPGNAEPTAAVTATPDSGNAPLTVAFDAGGSSDGDGSIVRYDWDFGGDGNFELYDGGPTPSWTYTGAGDFDAAVRVTDDGGAQDTATIAIDVNVPGNAEPQAALVADRQQSYAPYTISFDASASSDSDGAIVKYEWDFDGDGSYEEYGQSPTNTFTYPVRGFYLARVRVTDDDGAQDSAEYVLTLPTAWWMFGAEPTHNRRSFFVGAQTNNVLWWYTTAGYVLSSPAVGVDGTVYVGSYDYKLYAIKPGGGLKWSYPTAGYVASSPALAADGTIYVGSYDNKLYALNPDGSLKWSYTTGNDVFSSPAIAADGTVYVGSFDGKVYAIDPDGSLKWTYQMVQGTYSSPAIAADGTVYLSCYDWKLYALNPDGSLKWSYTLAGSAQSSPAIGGDGTVYVGDSNGHLNAIHPDGSFNWSYTTGATIYSSPAIAADGTVYVGSYDNKLHALNPDGSLKWSYTTGGDVYSSPSIGADGTVYFGSFDDKIYALNPDGSLKWSYLTGSDVQSCPTIGADGTVYVGGMDNKLYAFGPS